MKKENSAFPATAAQAQAGRSALRLGGGILLALGLAACAARSGSTRSLPPQDRQFLSEVRYIISRKESKMFKRTPQEERARFIEEFWKVRDPDPTTEENEFRDEYYLRIEEANRLFREGSLGWLSDRGRIFILLGEPDRRDVYPSGYSFYEPPVEIWFYGMFPIIFVDSQREGIYRLDPTSARRLSMINVAQMQLKPKGIAGGGRQFDFTLSVRAQEPGGATLVMALPYRVTKLVRDDGSAAYETKLKLTVKVLDAQGKTVLEKEDLRPVSVSDAMLADLGKNLVLEFAVALPAGSYTAQVTLENTTDQSRSSKEIAFRI